MDLPEQAQQFSQADYEIIKRDVPYEGTFRMARYELRYRLYQGGFSPVIQREVMERKSAVGVLLYDPAMNHVVLVEQFRAGAVSHPQSPWLVEIVAGVFNDGEPPAEAAKREAEEEAGCKILDLYRVYEYFVSPGGCNEKLTLFCGMIDAQHAKGIHGLAHENEDIKVINLPLQKALNWLSEGKIKTAPAIIALQWLALNQQWLQTQWQKNHR